MQNCTNAQFITWRLSFPHLRLISQRAVLCVCCMINDHCSVILSPLVPAVHPPGWQGGLPPNQRSLQLFPGWEGLHHVIYMVCCDWKVPVWFACGCHVPAILSQDEESCWSHGDSHPTQCLCCLEGHHFRVSDVEIKGRSPESGSHFDCEAEFSLEEKCKY